MSSASVRRRAFASCRRDRGAHRPVARWAGALLALVLLAPLPAPAFEFAVAQNAALTIDSDEAGASPAHRLSFDVHSGELEVYRVAITYPDAFRVIGFDALGPLHTPVGALLVDFDFDGVPDLSIPLRSLGPSGAYADVIPDGRFTPSLEPMLGRSGGSAFDLVLPFGGDADRTTLVAPRAARVSLVLFAGVLRSPAEGGEYTVGAVLTSVDPDTDGPDDGLGASPLTVAFTTTVSIAPTASALPPLFLHGGGAAASPADLFLDAVQPKSTAVKYRDSPVVSLGGGNAWKEIGAWRAAPEVADGVLSGPTPLRVWLGLRNSDDQGTQFDLRADVEKNGVTVATGIAHCITGVTRNPALARAATVSLSPSPPVEFDGTADVLRLRIFARIGTKPDGARCIGPGGSHASATGLRLYFDSVGRESALGALP
jgi:hypothetical protein